MIVTTNKKKFKYDFENMDDEQEELEMDTMEDINLTGASLKNTEIKRVEKEALPIRSILDDILEKDLTQRAYHVIHCSYPRKISSVISELLSRTLRR